MSKITGLKAVPPGRALSLVVLRKGAAGSCALKMKSRRWPGGGGEVDGVAWTHRRGARGARRHGRAGYLGWTLRPLVSCLLASSTHPSGVFCWQGRLG
jgi:hypothetical protein